MGKMIYEYDLAVTVEVQGETEEEIKKNSRHSKMNCIISVLEMKRCEFR
jgi:hypothetical protein